MSVGIIGRCDAGGLAALTREVHRHVRPARTLLLDLEEHGRGECIPDEYAHGEVYRSTFKGGIPDLAIEWLTAEGVDSIWSAETFYEDRILREAHGHGIRSVVYAMPELAPWHDPDVIRPRTITTPTAWRIDTLPANTQVLPLPVARDRLRYTERKQCTHLYHVVGSPGAKRAMLDRNGTEILLAALPFISSDDVRVTIRCPHERIQIPKTRAHVEVVSAPVADYWESYPADIDLLVLPRRYGGLSLPVQECAALGVPALMLRSDAYAQMGVEFINAIPSTGSSPAHMKGGRVPVHDADPRELAAAIDFLVGHPEQHHAASIEAGVWAEGRSWDGRLGDRWRATLDA